MEQLEEIVRKIDQVNVAYILADRDVVDEYNRYRIWLDTPLDILSKRIGHNVTEEHRNAIADSVYKRIIRTVSEYDELHLTPANAKVGGGATVCLYTDRYACTIIKVTKQTVTVRRDKATLSEDFKPEFIIGGFAAHCTNNNEQSWTYEPDENGTLYTIHWSKKYNSYGQPGNLRLIKGRSEFYDYNF